MKVLKRVFAFTCFFLFSIFLSQPAFAEGTVYELPGDVTFTSDYEVKDEHVIDLSEYTLTFSKGFCIVVRDKSKLYLKGCEGGQVRSSTYIGISVDAGGVLIIQDPVVVTGRYALAISKGAEVHLSSGTFSGSTAAFLVDNDDYASLLEEGCGYFYEDGSPMPLSAVKKAKTVVVKKLTEGTEHTEHTWEETGRIPSDCHVRGSVTYTCPECGETKTEELPLSSEHAWSEIGRTEPTVTSEGSITYECSVCGTTKSESIPKLEECIHLWVETGRTEPTLTSEGSISYKCVTCGTTKSESIPKLEECPHIWIETSRTEPTASRPGSIQYTCSQCGEIRTENIPVLPPAPLDPDSISFINWLGWVVSLFNMTLNSIISFPALRLFVGVLVFLMMFGLLARLLKQGRKGRL